MNVANVICLVDHPLPWDGLNKYIFFNSDNLSLVDAIGSQFVGT